MGHPNRVALGRIGAARLASRGWADRLREWLLATRSGRRISELPALGNGPFRLRSCPIRAWRAGTVPSDSGCFCCLAGGGWPWPWRPRAAMAGLRRSGRLAWRCCLRPGRSQCAGRAAPTTTLWTRISTPGLRALRSDPCRLAMSAFGGMGLRAATVCGRCGRPGTDGRDGGSGRVGLASPGGRLSVHETPDLVAAGLARPDLQLGVLVGWAAVTDGLAWPAVALYGAGIAWTLGYDTIYAHQDREDDALVGVKSTARLFDGRSRIWIGAFYGAALAGLAATGGLSGLGWPFHLGLLAVAGHFAWQVATLDADNPDRCLALFRSNLWAGFLVVGAIAVGA